MIPFWLMMAWRELRSAWRHFLYFLGCIALGVGAVVGVSLFSTNVERAVLKEARGLLVVPETLSRDLTRFTPVPGPIQRHRRAVAEAIENLRRIP